jgi:hypothetical protein
VTAALRLAAVSDGPAARSRMAAATAAARPCRMASDWARTQEPAPGLASGQKHQAAVQSFWNYPRFERKRAMFSQVRSLLRLM